MQGSKGSTSQTKSPEHPSDGNDCSSSEGVAEPPPKRAETRSREPRPREKGVTDQAAQPTSRAKATADKRPALENITNVARNMGKRTSPPRKAKAAKGVAPLEAALESKYVMYCTTCVKCIPTVTAHAMPLTLPLVLLPVR